MREEVERPCLAFYQIQEPHRIRVVTLLMPNEACNLQCVFNCLPVKHDTVSLHHLRVAWRRSLASAIASSSGTPSSSPCRCRISSSTSGGGTLASPSAAAVNCSIKPRTRSTAVSPLLAATSSSCSACASGSSSVKLLMMIAIVLSMRRIRRCKKMFVARNVPAKCRHLRHRSTISTARRSVARVNLITTSGVSSRVSSS